MSLPISGPDPEFSHLLQHFPHCKLTAWRRLMGSLTKQNVQWELRRGASLEAQWIRIGLPMQETRVPSPVWGDPTWYRAIEPMFHNIEPTLLEPENHNYWNPCALSPCSTTREVIATKCSPSSLQVEKSPHSNEDPAQPKINKLIKK